MYLIFNFHLSQLPKTSMSIKRCLSLIFSQIFIRYIVLQYGRLIHFNSPLNHYTFPCKTKIHLEIPMNNAPTDKKNWKRINFTRKSLVQVSTNIARATSSSVYRLLTRGERRPSKFDRPRKQHDGQPITR